MISQLVVYFNFLCFLMVGTEVSYSCVAELASGRQSDTFETTSDQSAISPNQGSVMCNYPSFLFPANFFEKFCAASIWFTGKTFLFLSI